MKIQVTLKDPDTMHDAVDDTVEREIASDASLAGLRPDERKRLVAERASEIKSLISDKWMDYGEYLVVEFDTEALTATVLGNKS